MKLTLSLSLGLLVGGVGFGCSNSSSSEVNGLGSAPSSNNATMAAAEAGKEAMAEIHGAGDMHDKIHGKATFMQEGNGVKVVVDVDGLTPGKHGIHIHEKPDLSDPKLMSVGGHFNPETTHKHSSPTDPM